MPTTMPIPCPPFPHLTTLLAVIGLVIVLLVLRPRLLQRPLPGIPHNAAAAGTLLGDLPAIRAHHPDRRRDWLARHPRRLGSAVSQVFIEPLRRPWVVITDFREAQDIMLRRSREFDRSGRARAHFGGVVPEHHITMRSDDPRFRANKELVRDLMTPAFLAGVSGPQIHAKMRLLVRLWELKAAAAAGRPFAAAEDIWGGTLDIIMAVAFGLEDGQSYTHAKIGLVGGGAGACARAAAGAGAGAATDAAADPADDSNRDLPMCFPRPPLAPELQALVTVNESLAVAMGSPFPSLTHWFYRQTPKMRGAVRVKDAMIRREIGRSLSRLEETEESGSWGRAGGQKGGGGLRCAMDQILLREMATAAKAGRRPDPYSAAIRDELVGYLVAGHDTTSTTIAWFVKFLSASPHSQARLRGALRATHAAALAEGRLPTAHEITSCPIPYLDAVVEETLRVSRTLPVLIRQASCDTTVLGHPIPKGTNLLLVCHGPSFLSAAIPVDEARRSETARAAKARHGEWDPESSATFAPERWLRVDGGGVEGFDPLAGPALPFGAGPRGCSGRKLAYMELRIAVTLLVWCFEFGALAGGLNGMEAVDRFTSVPRECYVRLRRL